MPENSKNKTKSMAQDNDIFVEEAPVEISKAEELAHVIVEAARNTGNEITYGEINMMISDSSPDKDMLEEIYDLVESKGIAIMDTREPSSNELEDDLDLDDDDIGSIVDEVTSEHKGGK